MWLRCVSTVFGLMLRIWAISRLVEPSVTMAAILHSPAVSACLMSDWDAPGVGWIRAVRPSDPVRAMENRWRSSWIARSLSAVARRGGIARRCGYVWDGAAVRRRGGRSADRPASEAKAVGLGALMDLGTAGDRAIAG